MLCKSWKKVGGDLNWSTFKAWLLFLHVVRDESDTAFDLRKKKKGGGGAYGISMLTTRIFWRLNPFFLLNNNITNTCEKYQNKHIDKYQINWKTPAFTCLFFSNVTAILNHWFKAMLSCTSALCRSVPAPRLRSRASRACPKLLPPRARAQPGTCSFLRRACGGSFKCLSPRSHFIVKILTAGLWPKQHETLPVVCSV